MGSSQGTSETPVYAAGIGKKQETPRREFLGVSLVAGAGFEPATFGL